MIMTSSITMAGVFLCGKIHLKQCWHFCTFLHNPHFNFEPDYVIRKPRKRRFQWYIVRTEIFSTFHPRVEYISVKTVIRQIDLPTPRAAMTPQSTYRLRTDRIKHHSIFFMCIFYIVFTFTVYCQLFDCMVASVQIKYLYLYLYPPPFTPFTWRI